MRNSPITSGIRPLLQHCLLAVILLLLQLNATSQQIREKITVKAGDDISAFLTSHGVYRFPQFRRATVKFKDGATSKALMNYNVVLNDIQFVNPAGDTLILDEKGLVDSILIDTDVFYYQKGLLQVVGDGDDKKLVMQQTNSFQYLKKAAMGRPDPTAAVISYDRVPTLYSIDNELKLTEDVVLIKEINFTLTYKKFKQTPANSSGFMKAFPEKKGEIENFVSANKIDFGKAEDIKRLFKFCVQHS